MFYIYSIHILEFYILSPNNLVYDLLHGISKLEMLNTAFQTQINNLMALSYLTLLYRTLAISTKGVYPDCTLESSRNLHKYPCLVQIQKL